MRVIRLVGEAELRLKSGQEGVRALKIAGLSLRDDEVERVAQSIDERVNLRRQSTF